MGRDGPLPLPRCLLPLLLLLLSTSVPSAFTVPVRPRSVVYVNGSGDPFSALSATGYDYVLLAFGDLTPNLTPAAIGWPRWCATASPSCPDQILTLQNASKRVGLSFGGPGLANQLADRCDGPSAPSIGAFASAVGAFVIRHGLDGVDLHIGGPDGGTATNLANATLANCVADVIALLRGVVGPDLLVSAAMSPAPCRFAASTARLTPAPSPQVSSAASPSPPDPCPPVFTCDALSPLSFLSLLCGNGRANDDGAGPKSEAAPSDMVAIYTLAVLRLPPCLDPAAVFLGVRLDDGDSVAGTVAAQALAQTLVTGPAVPGVTVWAGGSALSPGGCALLTAVVCPIHGPRGTPLSLTSPCPTLCPPQLVPNPTPTASLFLLLRPYLVWSAVGAALVGLATYFWCLRKRLRSRWSSRRTLEPCDSYSALPSDCRAPRSEPPRKRDLMDAALGALYELSLEKAVSSLALSVPPASCATSSAPSPPSALASASAASIPKSITHRRRAPNASPGSSSSSFDADTPRATKSHGAPGVPPPSLHIPGYSRSPGGGMAPWPSPPSDSSPGATTSGPRSNGTPHPSATSPPAQWPTPPAGGSTPSVGTPPAEPEGSARSHPQK